MKMRSYTRRMNGAVTMTALVPMPKAQHIALWAKHCGFMTAYAFVRQDNGDDGLRIDELMPIAQDEDESAELVTLRGVVLPQVELAGAGGEE